MWSLAYEFRCYLLVSVAGLCQVYRRPKLWLVMTLVTLVAMAFPAATANLPWPKDTELFGGMTQNIRMTAVFMVGGCFYLFRKSIAFLPLLAFAAVMTLMLVDVWASPSIFLVVFTICGGYLLFYLATSKAASRIQLRGLPDISYGLYLYGFPVESLWIWYHRNVSPWVTFAVSMLICSVIAWLSWHFIERPVLKFKSNRIAPLPPS